MIISLLISLDSLRINDLISFIVRMALEASYADALCLEPGVLSSTLEYHCWFGHWNCSTLMEKRRSCLCEQFVLFHGTSNLEVSEQTWSDLFLSKLGGVSHPFWGYRRLEQSVFGNLYVYKVLIEVCSLEDRNRVFNLIDRQSIPLNSDEFGFDHYIWLYGYNSCCIRDLFWEIDPFRQKKEACEVTFGDDNVLEEVNALLSEYLYVSGVL